MDDEEDGEGVTSSRKRNWSGKVTPSAPLSPLLPPPPLPPGSLMRSAKERGGGGVEDAGAASCRVFSADGFDVRGVC